MGGDLTEQIEALSDADAIAALAFVLDVEDASAADMDQLQVAQDRLPEAFEVTPDLGEITSAEHGVTSGDLARTALVYLAGEEATSNLVSTALNRPMTEGKHDPLTFAVGGLVLLALKTEVELKRTPAGKWSFQFHLRPMKDSALVAVMSKLWGLFGGGS